MKENYQIYLPYQYHQRLQTVDWDAQLPYKKKNENHVSLKYVKKSKTDFDFFPDNDDKEDLKITNAVKFLITMTISLNPGSSLCLKWLGKKYLGLIPGIPNRFLVDVYF